MQETRLQSVDQEDPLKMGEWLPTPVLLPREFHGQRILECYSPWGRRVGHESTTNTFTFFIVVNILKFIDIPNHYVVHQELK